MLNACKMPGMYCCGDSVEHLASYIAGYDAARDGGPLEGLREWLIVRGAIGNNQAWAAIIIAPDSEPPLTATPAELGQLLTEFFECRREQGLTKIHADYARWLLRKRWYKGPLRVSRWRRGAGEA